MARHHTKHIEDMETTPPVSLASLNDAVGDAVAGDVVIDSPARALQIRLQAALAHNDEHFHEPFIRPAPPLVRLLTVTAVPALLWFAIWKIIHLA